MKSISCKQAVDYILKKEEGKLSLIARVRLWQHLLICSLCRIFLRQNKLINTHLKHRKAKQYHLSEDDKEQMISNILNDKKS